MKLDNRYLIPLVSIAGIGGFISLIKLTAPSESMIAKNNELITRCIELKGDTHKCDDIKEGRFVGSDNQENLDTAKKYRSDHLKLEAKAAFEAKKKKSAEISARIEEYEAEAALKAYNSKIAWIPDGFKQWGDGNKIAYRQIKGTCNIFPCIDYEVVTKNGCPTLLYMKMALVDKSGRNRGDTNDTTSGVKAGQISVLRMELTNPDEAKSGYITEISCY
jgi:hypothetical protein